MVSNWPSTVFYLLPWRGWELLFGVSLSLHNPISNRSKITKELASVVGLAMILYAVFAFNKTTIFPGWAAVIPCLGAYFVIASNDDDKTVIGRLLSWRPIVFVGLISYSLYLWHWPVWVLAKNLVVESIPLAFQVILIVLSFVLAIASWRWVEAHQQMHQFVNDAFGSALLDDSVFLDPTRFFALQKWSLRG